MRRALALLAALLAGCRSNAEKPPEPRSQPARPDARLDEETTLVPDPHPDYPQWADVPVAADVDRGPHITSVDIPDRSTLTFTSHAHCEVDDDGVVCGPEPAWRDGFVRVGSRDGRPVLVEWTRGEGAEPHSIDRGGEGSEPPLSIDQTIVLEYDAAGLLVRMARLDESGEIDWVRSYRGRRYTSRNLDGSNALPGCGAIELARDTDGRVVSATCLDWSGGPMPDTSGAAAVRYQRDAAGFVVVEERFGVDGSPTAGHKDRVHRVDVRRDRWGRDVSRRFYDVAGVPTPSAAERGCYGKDRAYRGGEDLGASCLGNGLWRADDEEGVAVVKLTYDQHGCTIEKRRFDAEGRPAGRRGIHALRYDPDERCRTLAERCFDAHDRPVACGVDEPSAYHHELDVHGRTVASTFENPDGTRGVDANYHVPVVRYAYDDLGRLLATSCHAEDGFAIECGTTGYHRWAAEYDAAGRVVETRFYDWDGVPASNLGTWRRRWRYDAYDQVVEQRNLELDGRLIRPDGDGFALQRRMYDEAHRLLGIAVFDAAERPARYTSCFVGVACPDEPWHAMRILRSPGGRAVMNEYFDETGALIDTLDCDRKACWE